MSSSRNADSLARPHEALRALEGLRARIRRVFLIDGAIAMGLALCLGGLAAFALDYALQLPRSVRAILLAALVAYWGSVLVRRWLRPRRVELPLEDLAGLVEAEHPDLRQALVTAVALTRPGNLLTPHYSRDMVQAVVAEVERGLDRIRWDRVLRLGRLSQTATLLSAVGIAALLGVGYRSDLAAIGFRRLFLLAKENWPKSVQLALVSPTSNPVLVALGDDLPIEVRAARGHPGAIEIRYWSTGGSSGRDGDYRLELLRQSPDQAFRKVFENVSRPFRFLIRGGDDVLETVEVQVQLRPKVSRISLWCEYPAHTHRPATPANEPLAHGHLRAPVGTRVRFEAYSDTAVREAYFHFLPLAAERASPAAAGEKSPGAAEPEAGPAAAGSDGAPWPPLVAGAMAAPLAVEAAPRLSGDQAVDGAGGESTDGRAGAPGSVFRGEFEVSEDGHYQFFLLAENGLQNRTPSRYRVQAVADRAPQVRIVEPFKANEEVSPQATVSIRARARDEYGMRSGRIKGLLSVEGAGDKAIEFPLAELASEGDAEKEAGVVLEIAALGAPAGSRLQYQAEASDFGGNVGESDPYTIQVVSPSEVLRLLFSELLVIKSQIDALERQQESARKDLAAFTQELLLAGKLDAASSGKLTRHRQNQQRVTRGISKAASEMDRILRKMETNQVGNDKDKDWLSRVRDELGDLGDDRSKAIEETIAKLRDQAATAPQEPTELSPLVDKQRQVETELHSLSLRLSEFGDLNAVLQQWRDILRRQLEIRDGVVEELQKEGRQP